MKYRLQDLIDMEQFQSLQDRLNEIYSFPSAIIDNEGTILTATAWQDICTKFHRKHPECEKECVKSDKYILEHLAEANPAVSYRCPHGLIDNATPIVINGEHLGNFFTGQFFLEPPDLEPFRRQAGRYGFDETDYLAAVQRVPVWSQEQLNNYLFFIKGLIEVVANIGLKNLKVIEARKNLETSEERHRTIIEAAMDGFWLLDQEGRFLQANDAYCTMSGYSAGELLTMSIADVEAAETRVETTQHLQRLIAEGRTRFETRHRRKDGSRYDVEVSAQYHALGDGCIFAFVHDITDRKAAEERLQKSEANFKKAELLGNLGNWEWNIASNQLAWSDQVFRIYGMDPAKDKASMDVVLNTLAPECRAEFEGAVENALKNNAVFDGEYRIIGLDGRERYTHTSGQVLRDASGRPVSLFGVVQDVSERRRTEEELRSREAFIRNILESVDEGFIVLDRSYRVVAVNRAFCQLAGVVEQAASGRHCYELSHHADKPCFENGEDCPARQTFETGKPHAVLHSHADAGGTGRFLEIKSYPITDGAGRVVSVIETMNDVTEKKKLEDQLRQAQKMEAIGTLAGGVAHDFNNILTAIVGYANILRMKLGSDDPRTGGLDQILAASERAANLTKALLAFSRKQPLDSRQVDVNDVVRNVEKLLQRIIGEDVELTVRLAPRNLVVLADAGQLGQVLMNLAANARDAMPRGGSLIITTEEAGPGGGAVSGAAGNQALITVSDTGEGIDKTLQEKIFEPFFTTKGQGKGTGLGLAIVYGIIKQHGGSISVYSEPGRGTTFRIHLPLLGSAAASAAPSARAAVPARGTETILLAEDEEGVRRLITVVLNDFGYRVIAAADGQEALERFAAARNEIDLAILDVIMPKRSGKEVSAGLKSSRPDLDILFVSGYAPDMITQLGMLEEGIELLQKPLDPYDLLRKVRTMLDRKKA